MSFIFKILPLSSIFLLLTAISSTSATSIGVTYDPSSPSLPAPERVASTLKSLHVPAVRLLDPTPAAIRAFSYSNISLIISIPNSFIPSFAANRSYASLWLYSHVLPFHPRSRISLISVGTDVISSSSSDFLEPHSDPSTSLIPAMHNLHLALVELGIKTISVSTTFSFINIMTTAFPPSSAEFQEPINQIIIQPLLEFLDETNSSLLVNIFPYMIYRLNSEIPIGYSLFQEHPFNFRDDALTGVRYRNLFDMMVDSVVAAMAISGHENIPLIVAETGWPSTAGNSSAGNAAEPEASEAYAEMYLKGLISHLNRGLGTPLRKEGVAEVYIYALFDGNDPVMNGNGSYRTGQHWGILFPNMTLKYNIDFSGSGRAVGNGSGGIVPIVLEVVSVVAALLML